MLFKNTAIIKHTIFLNLKQRTNIMRTITLITLLTIITLGVNAEKYAKASNTSIKFKIKNAGSYTDGSFKTVSAEGTYDDEDADNIKLSGTAQVKSVSTGNSLRDRHLREKEEFFNMDKTPTVTMKSYKVVKESNGEYTVYWELTMRGITQKIKTTMIAKKSSGGYDLSTNFKINRNTWKLGGGGIKTIAMDDIVIIDIKTSMK